LSLSADGFVGDLTELVAGNDVFRRVLYTSADGMQLVAMTLRPGENIGLEVHPHADQFVRVEAGGKGFAVLGHTGKGFEVAPGAAVLIPAGVPHDIINTDPEQPLRLSVVYSRPLELRGLVQPCRETNV
jgi:mannose-6-phosphate isomerase-like protein (cupin superfamily)